MITDIFERRMTQRETQGTYAPRQPSGGVCDGEPAALNEMQQVLELNSLSCAPNPDRAISDVCRSNARGPPGFAGKLICRAPRLAWFDSLTMLPSRTAVREKLRISARAAEALGQSVALILLDLDDFHDVNDTYGQAAGDACLQRVADRLIETVGAAGFLARMGEDEFTPAGFSSGYHQNRQILHRAARTGSEHDHDCQRDGPFGA